LSSIAAGYGGGSCVPAVSTSLHGAWLLLLLLLLLPAVG
jgi:hypothetical protein